MGSRTRRATAIAAAGLTTVATLGALPAAAAAEPAADAAILAPYYTELDVTGDRQVTADDVLLVAESLGQTPGDAGWIPTADVDGDEVLTITDVAAVSQRMIYDDGPFELLEASVVDMQAAMNAGATTSVDITTQYLDRIEAYDTALIEEGGRPLHSIISVNDAALAAAADADAVRAEQGMTSMLLGVPVAMKDNYDTADMPTTAGCGCWNDNQTATDAFMVSGLRADGAVIVAKASLDEFAYGFASEFSAFQEVGDSVLVASPYNTNQTAGGSSGGTGAAIAANLAGIGFGTDTGGSIRVPSSYNQLVGIRPTVGLASRDGIVPLALSQDTGGPMARSVLDAAVALDAVVGIDEADPATAAQAGLVPESYTEFLDDDALDGARIGYIGSMFDTTSQWSPTPNATVERVWSDAQATIEGLGGEVVPIEEPEWFAGLLAEGSGSTNEFRHDLDIYIENHLSEDVEARSLDAIIDTGHFVVSRQGTYETRAAVTEEQYEAWMDSHTAVLAQGKVDVQALLDEYDVDALVYPSGSTYGTIGRNLRLSPNTGLPAVTVPMGVSIPEDGTAANAGVNLEWLGRDFGEGTLLGLTYAFEQATGARTSPELYGALAG
ncbi:amidase family protein [Microbacterium sp. ZXX196]|uniref:amidase family protein n=1 Tax=Microbacterium sp. ZXX196 TaxID=2609291 RepID=UPI0012BA03A0|nr:amidase family protein [Microbacterium sp. ZXX196]MTE23005.1 hypothetical protein [Microbacterium sp. ZXX196]